MFNFLLFSLASLGAQAFYPYNEQTPLIPDVAPSFVVLLEVSNARQSIDSSIIN